MNKSPGLFADKPEPLRTILITNLINTWDIEYWDSFLLSASENDILCKNKNEEIKHYRIKHLEATKKYKNHRIKYSEHFI